jgi:hypothetical protein
VVMVRWPALRNAGPVGRIEARCPRSVVNAGAFSVGDCSLCDLPLRRCSEGSARWLVRVKGCLNSRLVVDERVRGSVVEVVVVLVGLRPKLLPPQRDLDGHMRVDHQAAASYARPRPPSPGVDHRAPAEATRDSCAWLVSTSRPDVRFGDAFTMLLLNVPMQTVA